MALSEFELIQNCFARQAAAISRADVKLGIGDDCAILTPCAGKDLVASVDTLVAGVHFPHTATPCQIAYRSLAVNLSDLAAMGAEPAWFTLALTLPESDEAWLNDFSRGLFAAAAPFNIALVGGDTTRGPLSITIQVQGYVTADMALRRDAARVGDLVCVSGCLGDAGGALELLQEGLADAGHPLIKRFYFPEPRLSLGRALEGIASAAIDISDGLLADLTHILQRSGVGARIDFDAIPLSTALLDTLGRARATQLALSAGDDYELCFCLPPEQYPQLQHIQALTGVPVRQIGVITPAPGLELLDAQGQPVEFTAQGYQHF